VNQSRNQARREGKVNPIEFKESELPVAVIIRDNKPGGELVVYQLTRASRKLGASLQKLEGSVKDIVLRNSRRK